MEGTPDDLVEVLAGDVVDEEIPEIEVDIFQILNTISDALRELFARVEELEKRPQFAASIKGRA